MTNFTAPLCRNIVKDAGMIASRFFVKVFGHANGIRRKVAQDVPRPTVARPRSVGMKKFYGFVLHKLSIDLLM